MAHEEDDSYHASLCSRCNVAVVCGHGGWRNAIALHCFNLQRHMQTDQKVGWPFWL